MRPCKLSGLLLMAGIMTAGLSHPVLAGGIVIGGTRVFYEDNKKEASLNVKNNNTENPFLIQSWVDTGDGKTRGPFIVTPPLFRIEPLEERTLRIAKTRDDLPENKESLFYLNIRAIPPSDPASVNTLKLVVKTRLKLFYRPRGLVTGAQDAYKKLRFQLTGQTLTVENPTPWHVVFEYLKVGTTTLKQADMVGPFGQNVFTLPSTERSRRVTWSAINDYGGATKSETRAL